MRFRTRGHDFELQILSMNSTNETLLFVRFLIVYEFLLAFHCNYVPILHRF